MPPPQEEWLTGMVQRLVAEEIEAVVEEQPGSPAQLLPNRELCLLVAGLLRLSRSYCQVQRKLQNHEAV